MKEGVQRPGVLGCVSLYAGVGVWLAILMDVVLNSLGWHSASRFFLLLIIFLPLLGLGAGTLGVWRVRSVIGSANGIILSLGALVALFLTALVGMALHGD
jgi:hypothetical protein